VFRKTDAKSEPRLTRGSLILAGGLQKVHSAGDSEGRRLAARGGICP
jgi:hypothetical protein